MAKDKDQDLGLSPEIERLSAQLARDPNSKLFIPLAEEYMKSDMAEEAIMTLEEGLKAHPAYMSARVLLGKAYLAKGEMDKACEQFEKVIKAVPDNLFALRKLGEIYLAQGRSGEALKNFRILALLSPKDDELNGLIKKLEAGELPPSPLAIPAEEPETAAEPPEIVQKPAVLETPVPEGVELEPEEPDEESVEGAVPTYEIDEEALEDLGVQAESTHEAQGADTGGGFDLDLGADIPEPEIEEPSPFEMAEEVPFQPGEAPGGFMEPEPQDEAAQPQAGAAAGELQDIFASYGSETREEISEPGTGVYELEEPSDFDLAELGVKSSMTPVVDKEDSGSLMPDDMPFEIEGESDLTVAEAPVFEMAEEQEEHPFSFDEEPVSAAPDTDEALFDKGAEEVSPFEEAFAPEGFEMEHESGATPFEMSEDIGLHPQAEEPFMVEDDFGAIDEASPFELVESEPAPVEETFEAGEPPREEAHPAHEPINTETLAEMYIRQGFYDRAIAIYKELLRDAPGDNILRQKLDELYMLAGLTSTRAASEGARQAPAMDAIEPADFVNEAEPGFDEPVYEDASPITAAEHVASAPAVSGDVVVRLEQFLENIKRKGRQ